MARMTPPKKRPRMTPAAVPVTHAYQTVPQPPSQVVFEGVERRMGFPCIAYWTSYGGSICQNDVMVMANLIEEMPKSAKLGLFMKSNGGNPEAALRLVHLLRSRFGKIVLLAPFECASAATMVALGANEIHMGATSYLTAVDSSLKHELAPVDHNNYAVSVSQDEVSRILRLWKEQRQKGNPFPEVYKYLHPLVIGALDRSSSLSIRICEELLSYHMSDRAKARLISRKLNSDYPSHSYPITSREAARLGLHVRQLEQGTESLLRRLNEDYSSLAQLKREDRDAQNHHASEICNILERRGCQVHFSVDKDWIYRPEERRWVSINDKSTWQKITFNGKEWQKEALAIC